MSINADNTGRAYQDYRNDGATIHVKQVHSNNANATTTDKVESSSNAYQEDHVPAADSPQLEPGKANASPVRPPASPQSEKVFFQQSLLNQMNNLSPEQFAALQKNNPNILTKEQAQNFLKFAMNNPNSKEVSPEAKEVMQQLINAATSETKAQLNLGDKWQPPGPDSQALQQALQQENDQNFESLVRNMTAFNQSEGEAIIFAHYHPESAGNLNANQKQFLKAAEAGADAQTHFQEGLPDSVKLPSPNSQAYDSKLNAAFAAKFESLVSDLKQKGVINEQEAAQLKTLHYDSNANVADRGKLLSLAKQLDSHAMKFLQEKFQLPGTFKPPSMSEAYYERAQAQFKQSFGEKVMSMLGKLSPGEMKLLLGTNGMSGSNLPPELQKVFQDLKSSTLSDIIDKLGLPKDWKPKTLEGDPKTAQAKASAKSDNAQGSNQAQAANKTDQTQKTAFSAVKGVQNSTDRAEGTQEVKSTQAAGGPDLDLAHQVIQQLNQYQAHFQDFSASWLNGPDQITMGTMFEVSTALSMARDTAYALEAANSISGKATTMAQKDMNEAKIIEQKHKMEEAEKNHPKTFFLFDIIQDINIPPFAQVAQLWQDVIQLQMWMLDTLLGGVLSMLCEAMKMQPIAKNPLLMAGIINESQAKTMDFAMQMIVMAAEMAVEACLGQGELIALQVSRISAKAGATGVAEATAKIATEIATTKALSQTMGQVAKEAAEKAAFEAAKNTTGQAMTKELRVAIEEQVEKAVQQAIEQQLKNAAEQGASEAVLKSLQSASKNLAGEMSEKATKAALQNAKNYVPKGYFEAFMDGVSAVGGTISNATTGAARSALSKVVDLNVAASELGKTVGTAAETAAKQAGENATKEEVKALARKAAEEALEQEISKGLNKELVKSLDDATKKQMIDAAASRAADNAIADATKSGVTGAIGRSASAISEGLEATNRAIMKKMQKILEKQADVLEETVKAFEKAAEQAATNALTGGFAGGFAVFQLARDIVQGTSGTAQGIMEARNSMQKADQARKMAEIDAQIAFFGGNAQIMQKMVSSLQKNTLQLVQWVEQINQEQSRYWQTQKIQFVA